MKRRILIAVGLFAVQSVVSAQQIPAAAPGLDAETLRVQVRAADEALGAGPFSVMDKTSVAPSGDKHDYFSLSPYHWPNPDTPDGKPYVYRDGKRNPTVCRGLTNCEVTENKYDREGFAKMTDTVLTLCRAYRQTGKQAYAVHAARLLRVWFLDPATCMNPNLQYSQHVMGKERGPSWGIIEGRKIVRLAQAADSIGGPGAWTEQDQTAWKAWLDKYVHWLRESDMGKEESNAWNNHGTWYDVQVAVLALECGQETIAKEVLAAVGVKRIAKQIEPDGRQKIEIIRTKSWDYSVMNLEGLFELASLGERVGVYLWRFKTDDGRGIRGALDYLIPFATGGKKWPHKQITAWRPEELCPLLRLAAVKYQDDAYSRAARAISKIASEAARDGLLDPTGDP